jgi:RecB family exonuclease
VITPRRTRLIRVADLHDFRRAIAALCAPAPERSPDQQSCALPARLVVVPTSGAATTLRLALGMRGIPADPSLALVTRDEIYDALHDRLPHPPRRLTAFERDAITQAAAMDAAREQGELPFQVRPGLVAEMLRFYDQLRRQSQLVVRFDELISNALGGGELDDRGADRLLRQTRFLARTFRLYEQRTAAVDAVDEHRLRERLLEDAAAVPLAHVIVTVPDWIADPAGLFVADFDLLNRLPNLAAIDIVSTEGVLASGFHERLDNWWPGIEALASTDLIQPARPGRPMLVVPEPTSEAAPLWFTHRDREDELVVIARRLAAEPATPLDSVGVVFKRPLPYLYLATDTLGAAGIPYVVSDALPLAAEPFVATVDLVLDLLESDFARDAIVAVMRSPHLEWASRLSAESVAALDRALSEDRYLGGADRLVSLSTKWPSDAVVVTRGGRDPRVVARAALEVAVSIVSELTSTPEPPASSRVRTLIAFIERHLAAVDDAHPLGGRERRARTAVLGVLSRAAEAHAEHHDPPWTVGEFATSVRRWIGDQTFAPEGSASGVRLLDDQAARYGDFDDITIVGLIENEWPERSRRNIFYPPSLLKALNWPSEKDRRAAADARFLDLLGSASSRVELSAFLLEDEAIVSRSIQLDEVPRARLSTATRPPITRPLIGDETLALEDAVPSRLVDSSTWLELRRGRASAGDAAFHGSAGAVKGRVWSVSALETYIGCPFKFFAQHVLRLEEEPDDEEVMDPRRQGLFVHEVFELFFREWQEAGHTEITPARLPLARDMFRVVVDRALERVPEGEAALERTRLLGSPAASGLGEAVFRMEAERPVAVVARLLEHRLDGPVTIQTADGPRTISVRGKADRLDLLADGTFRLIDYKLGWPPDRGKALQLPIYALCAEQQVDVLNRKWTIGEAVYLAFKGPKRVVPLFTSDAARVETLQKAQQRMADTLDAIERGEFPPSPDDVYRCESCSFTAVCRKDYVGDI